MEHCNGDWGWGGGGGGSVVGWWVGGGQGSGVGKGAEHISTWTVSLGPSSGPLVDPFVCDRAPTHLTQSPWNSPNHASSASGVQREAWTQTGGRPRLSSLMTGRWDF